jgi:heme A synthase
MRWLEWGTRSYENFTLGVAVLLFAIAMVRTARVPRPIPYLMGLSALVYWVQGWAAGTQGFSQTQSTGIVLAEVLNAAWMVWLLVVSRRMSDREPASLGR